MATKAVETMQKANRIYEMDELPPDNQLLSFLIWSIEFLAILIVVVFFLQ